MSQTLRADQLDLLERTQAAMRRHRHVCVQAGCGWGKCLGRGTPVLMHDGSTKPVEDVVVGDMLMGPDSRPRTVLSLARGRGPLFRVVPVKGDAYVVNESHVLSLKIKTRANHPHEVVNVSVRDYFAAPQKFRVNAKGYRVAVEFPARPVPLDPYYLGIWLADGSSSSVTVFKPDPEISDYLRGYAAELGMLFTDGCPTGKTCPSLRITNGRGAPGGNQLWRALKSLGVAGNKHVPDLYRVNSREVRLQLLAGLLDGEGSLRGDCCYDFSNTNRQISESVVWLARSVGLAAYMVSRVTKCQTGAECLSYRVCISGHCDMIPCRIARKQAKPRRIYKDALVTGIKVEPIGEGDYYGFEVDGDHLFLLGDFTVTHNSSWASEVVRRAAAKGTRVLLFAHRRKLIQQLSDRLDLFGVPHGVIMANMPESLFRRNRPRSPVQVVSKDTLISRAAHDGWPAADLVVIDEAHRCLSQSMTDILRRYEKAYRIGMTATPCGGDGRGLGDYFGELVCAPPVSKLIEDKIVVPFKVYAALEMKGARLAGGKVRPAGDPVEQWKRFADGKPTVVFAPNVSASRAVVESFMRSGIPAVHIDAHSTDEERDDASDGLESGKYTVVSNCNLWSEGTDVPCIGVVQLMTKCGSLVKYVQATQRAGRAYPGKTFATVIDHCGAIFDHGFPDTDLEWSLSPGSPVKKAKKSPSDPDEDPEGPNPFVCTRCGLCYSGAVVCPGCGCPLAVNRKMYQPDLFAHLVEVEREGVEAVREESVQRVWTHMLFLCARSGKRVKQLAAMFWKRTGRWPDEAGVSPLYDRADLPELVADVFPEYAARLKTGGGRRDDTPNLFGEAA